MSRRAGDPLVVPGFVVIGGGVDGAFYVRQLQRAVAAGRLATERIRVVDRDASCAVAGLDDPRLRLEVADWGDWLDAHLDGFGPEDHLVPYHWAPHLLFDWLARQVAHAGGSAVRGGDVPPRGVPYEATTGAGDRALSYATWPCPPACIEPALCPHTRGPKDWSLAGHLAEAGAGFDAALVFRCLHLVWGVGTIPLAEIRASRDRVLQGLAAGPRRWLVSTSSHCHALAAVMRVEPRAPCRERLNGYKA
jgi:hypothetical protein